MLGLHPWGAGDSSWGCWGLNPGGAGSRSSGFSPGLLGFPQHLGAILGAIPGSFDPGAGAQLLLSPTGTGVRGGGKNPEPPTHGGHCDSPAARLCPRTCGAEPGPTAGERGRGQGRGLARGHCTAPRRGAPLPGTGTRPGAAWWGGEGGTRPSVRPPRWAPADGARTSSQGRAEPRAHHVDQRLGGHLETPPPPRPHRRPLQQPRAQVWAPHQCR